MIVGFAAGVLFMLGAYFLVPGVSDELDKITSKRKAGVDLPGDKQDAEDGKGDDGAIDAPATRHQPSSGASQVKEPILDSTAEAFTAEQVDTIKHIQAHTDAAQSRQEQIKKFQAVRQQL